MKKSYVIWWHSQFIDEIDRESTSINEIIDKVKKTLKHLEALGGLEKKGKIKVRTTHALNPICIDILDSSVEDEIANNPIVEITE